MKECSKCKEKKEYINFSTDKYTKTGYKSQCKKCVNLSHKNNSSIKEYNKKYYSENKNLIKEKRKIYRENNFEKIKECHNKRKDKRNNYSKEKRKNDYLFKLRNSISNLIRSSIKKNNFSKNKKTIEILGCNVEIFKQYIENKFKEGMYWENHGKWHLDHIYPISLAKNEEEIIKLNHYTNFQPLWAEENIRKGNRLDY